MISKYEQEKESLKSEVEELEGRNRILLEANKAFGTRNDSLMDEKCRLEQVIIVGEHQEELLQEELDFLKGRNREMHDRIRELAVPENFPVNIRLELHRIQGLSNKEYGRLRRKMPLVEKAASKLVAGMVKGILKYDTDEWTVAQWLDYAEDEAIDLVNYMGLLRAALTKETHD